MPYHLSENGLSVLDASGHVVPGGTHKTRAEALAHEQAMNINVRREEGKPVAPKLNKGIRLPNGEFDAQKAITEEERDKIPAEDFVDPQNKRFYIRNASDVMDAVQSYGRANPKIPYDTFKQRLTAIARRKGFESSLPDEWKQNDKKSPVDEQDPNGYVGTDYVDGPKEKSSWLSDPTSDELFEWMVDDGFDKSKSQPPYVDREMGDMLADRAFYHHSPERYTYRPSPDWNDDTTSLPDVWVRAHPFGSPYSKDAHSEYFDRQTQFHDKDLPNVPVTYYHNYNPDGTPKGEPTAIGKTVARKYLHDGRWDKIQFNNEMDSGIKTRIAKALQTGTLRASPTVVPDFHKVNDRSGHIDHWLTGSIAVLDAHGERQPASPLAIGIPAMKALFKQAQIPFPKNLKEVSMGTSKMKGASLKARMKATLKAMVKALDEEEVQDVLQHKHEDGTEHSHEGGDREHHHEGEDMKAVFEDSNPEDAANVPYGLGNTYWTNQYNGPQTERDRVDGADRANVQKDVQGLANIENEEKPEAPEANELGDSDIRLDWSRQEKRMKMMKAQLSQLQAKSDIADFNAWFTEQLTTGRVLPAEREDLRIGYLQALSDDRQYHPVMKAAGQYVSRVRLFQGTVERREPKFGEHQLTLREMKALGYQAGGFDQTPAEQEFNDKRRDELLEKSPLGAKILQDKKK